MAIAKSPAVFIDDDDGTIYLKKKSTYRSSVMTCEIEVTVDSPNTVWNNLPSHATKTTAPQEQRTSGNNIRTTLSHYHKTNRRNCQNK